MTITWMDNTTLSLPIQDQRQGYPTIPQTYIGQTNPWVFDFELSRPLQNISTISVDPITFAAPFGTQNYAGWLQIHDWQTGTELYSSNRDGDPVSVGSSIPWTIQSQYYGMVFMYFNISHLSGPSVPSSIVEITLAATLSNQRATYRTSLTLPQEGQNRIIRLWPWWTEMSMLRIGVLGKVLININTPASLSNGTIYSITDFRISSSFCTNNFNLQTCTNTTDITRRVFTTLPGRIYKIANTSKKYASLPLHSLNAFIDSPP